ncbi:MAG: NUDIX hydrolase [Lachnospiraceae bacterium]|nr:NUDIX hydrolase [Lachnospiraceae bacterium]
MVKGLAKYIKKYGDIGMTAEKESKVNQQQEDNDTLEEFLKKYDDSKYEKPSVTADIIIFSKKDDNIKVLLIKRKSHPFKDSYALPGGFTNSGESLEESARRELFEETSLECDNLEQLRTFSTPGRDPRRWVMTCAFMAIVDADECMVEAGDDAKEAEWFDIKMKPFYTDNRYELLLQYGDTKIRAIVEKTSEGVVSGKPEFKLLESENIAFDHGLILAYAMDALAR